MKELSGKINFFPSIFIVAAYYCRLKLLNKTRKKNLGCFQQYLKSKIVYVENKANVSWDKKKIKIQKLIQIGFDPILQRSLHLQSIHENGPSRQTWPQLSSWDRKIMSPMLILSQVSLSQNEWELKTFWSIHVQYNFGLK